MKEKCSPGVALDFDVLTRAVNLPVERAGTLLLPNAATSAI